MRTNHLLSLLASAATLASASPTSSASRSECLSSQSKELAALAKCGTASNTLGNCLEKLSSADSSTLSQAVEQCFQEAGCPKDQAAVEALSAMQRCESPADLRRARRNSNAFAAAAALNMPRDPSLDLVTALAPRQEPATTTSGNPTSPSPCFTETTVTITQCPTDSNGKKNGPCTPAPSPSQVCREGLICRSDNQGNPSCMFKHSKLDIGGIIIAIFFAVAIVLSVFSICFMCCRERREQTRLEKAAEAAKIAKEAKAQATAVSKRPGRSVTGAHGTPETQQREPLMDSSSGYGGAASAGAAGGDVGQQQQPSGQYGAANPFVDSAHDGHPLR